MAIIANVTEVTLASEAMNDQNPNYFNLLFYQYLLLSWVYHSKFVRTEYALFTLSSWSAEKTQTGDFFQADETSTLSGCTLSRIQEHDSPLSHLQKKEVFLKTVWNLDLISLIIPIYGYRYGPKFRDGADTVSLN